jgi:hypothetical protein
MFPLHQVAWNFYVHVIATQEGGLVSMIIVPLSARQFKFISLFD